MEQFTPPTDNLYKFMALSGILLCIVALIFPMIRLDKLQEKVFQTKESAIELDVDKKHEEWDVKQLKFDVTATDQKITSLKKLLVKNRLTYDKKRVQEEQAVVTKLVNEQKQRFEAVDKKRWEIEKRNALLSEKTRQLVILFKQQKNDLWAIFGFELSGILLAFRGFTLWYQRLQKWLDRDARQPKTIP